MKKTYINPEVSIDAIAAQHVLLTTSSPEPHDPEVEDDDDDIHEVQINSTNYTFDAF